jgi:hypothetical protein
MATNLRAFLIYLARAVCVKLFLLHRLHLADWIGLYLADRIGPGSGRPRGSGALRDRWRAGWRTSPSAGDRGAVADPRAPARALRVGRGGVCVRGTRRGGARDVVSRARDQLQMKRALNGSRDRERAMDGGGL